jgi:hypothetical protein
VKLPPRIRSVKLVRAETNVDAGVFCRHEPLAHRADSDSVVCLDACANWPVSTPTR